MASFICRTAQTPKPNANVANRSRIEAVCRAALQLYDALQANEKLLVQFEPDDERILEGEQGRAQRVVQAWFANQ